MRLRFASFSFGVFLAVVPMTAHADVFTITGASQISFSLPASPTPSTVVQNYGFTVNNVSVLVGGETKTENILFFEDGIAIGPQVSIVPAFLGFDVDAPGAVLEAYSTVPNAFLPFADPLYGDGTEADPTFNLGTYALEDYNTGNIDSTLTITADAGAVATTPEPSSFALLGTGLLGIAGVVRKRFA